MTEPIQDSVFHVFHNYNRLVRRQIVPPLACECGGTMVTAIGPEDALMLECYECGTKKVPGKNTIDNVRAIVQEHFL